MPSACTLSKIFYKEYYSNKTKEYNSFINLYNLYDGGTFGVNITLQMHRTIIIYFSSKTLFFPGVVVFGHTFKV